MCCSSLVFFVPQAGPGKGAGSSKVSLSRPQSQVALHPLQPWLHSFQGHKAMKKAEAANACDEALDRAKELPKVEAY